MSVDDDRQAWIAALRRHVEAQSPDMPVLDGSTVLRLFDLLGEAREAGWSAALDACERQVDAWGGNVMDTTEVVAKVRSDRAGLVPA